MILRKCIKCGLEANNKDELDKFVKHKNSTYGRSNICRECKTKYQRKWMKGYREGPNYTRSKQRIRKQGRKDNTNYRLRKRQEVINLYGRVCSCCGESHFEFLTLDHIQGNGTKERKKLGGSYGVYLKAIRLFHSDEEEANKTYRILCWNCNCSLGSYGFCPHNQ